MSEGFVTVTQVTELEKRGRVGRREPFVPDRAWIEAFEAQYGGELYERMKRFALSKSRVLRHYGQVVDEYFAEELVADVIDDTLRGEITWDPARVDLKKHVLDTIQYRIRDACKHADQFRPVSLDDEVIENEAGEALADAAIINEDRARMAAALTATLDALRALASDDPEVVRLIDAYRGGATEKSELLSVTGLTTLQYKAARERLHTLLNQLPDHLRTDAMRIR